MNSEKKTRRLNDLLNGWMKLWAPENSVVVGKISQLCFLGFGEIKAASEKPEQEEAIWKATKITQE